MEMISRYIYAVTQRLPLSQRDDIAEELRSLIEDMLDERVQGGRITDKDVEAVLLDLGSPKLLAQKYRGSKGYLIGSALFYPYVAVLKVVLISIVVATSVVFAVQSILNPVTILDHFVNYIVSWVTLVPQAFGWVTLVFVCIEYFGGIQAGDFSKDHTWKPVDLPPVPNPKRQIKRCEPVAGIVFYVLLMFTFSSDYFGVFVFEEGEFSTVVPFLNEGTFSTYLPFIILLLGMAIVKESLKLILRKWTPKLTLYSALINVLSLIVVIVMMTGPAFWNPDFMQELIHAGVVSEGSEAYETVSNIWHTSTLLILILLIVGLIWDTVNGFIKIRKTRRDD